MKARIIMFGLVFVLLPRLSLAYLATDDTKAEFDAGAYTSNTKLNVANAVELNNKTLLSGTYTSNIKNSGGVTDWSKFSWQPQQAYQKPLPDFGASETGYSNNLSMNGIVGLWHLDEATAPFKDTANLVGLNNGTCATTYNTYCPALEPTGKFGTSVNFNAQRQYITTPLNPSTLPTTTWSVWIKPTASNNDGQQHYVISDANAGRGIQINRPNSTATSQSLYYSFYYGNWNFIYTPVTVDYDKWQHLVVVFDNKKLSFYKNGILQFSTTVAAITAQGTQFTLGGNTGANITANQYHGQMDEVAVFNRTLEQAEIENMYARGVADIKFQLRACNDATCSQGNYMGPDGTSGSFFTDAGNTTNEAPVFQNLLMDTSQYIQYKADFITSDSGVTPVLSNVTVQGATITTSTDIEDSAANNFNDGGDYDDTDIASTGGTAFLQLADDGLGKYVTAGTFTSSIKDSGYSNTVWDYLGWQPYQAYQKPLPDFGASETGYSNNLSMNDIVGLWHLDENTNLFVNKASTTDNNKFTCGIHTLTVLGVEQGGSYNCPTLNINTVFAKGASFTKTNQYISNDYSSPRLNLNYSVMPNTTWSVWIKPTKPATVADYDTNYHFVLSDNSNGRNIQIYQNNYYISNGSWTQPYFINTNVPVTYDTWQHMAISYSGGQVTLYKNGQSVYTTTVPTGAQGDRFGFGTTQAFGTSGKNQYYGDMDEVAVFKRALSATEVENMYMRGAVQFGVQLRVCDDVNCDTENFTGPNGDSTYYNDLDSNADGAPYYALANMKQQYIQYKLFFNTSDTAVTPKLQSVALKGTGSAETTNNSVPLIDWSQCRVEQGETTITDTGENKTSVTVTLDKSLTNITKALLLVNSTGDSNVVNAADHLVSGYISSASELVFERIGTAGTAQISYTLVECKLDEFSVQRGEITINNEESFADSNDLTPIVDSARSLVLVSSRTADTQVTEKNGLVTGKLKNNKTVEVARGGSTATTLARYEVVTFSESSNVKILAGETAIPANFSDVSATVDSLNASQDRIWLYCSYNTTGDSIAAAAVGCNNTDGGNTAEFSRSEAGEYVNTINYYAIAFPENTVITQQNVVENNSTESDGERYDQEITLPKVVDTTNKAFAFVTNTTKGTGQEFPRNRWLTQLTAKDKITASFWRSDENGESDLNNQYWQVIQFPLYTNAQGYGWIGNAAEETCVPSVLLPGKCGGVGFISFASENSVATDTPKYGVQLEIGDDCAENCLIKGFAWVGNYAVSDVFVDKAKTLGWLEFQPDLTSKPDFVDKTAYWDERTGVVSGWARWTSISNHGKDLYNVNDWGWVKLRGDVKDSSGNVTGNYGVYYDTTARQFSGFSWNGNGTDGANNFITGSGLGWMRFDADVSSATKAWLQTLYGDVYAKKGFTANTTPPVGQYNATYLIQANDTITGFTSEFAEKNATDYAKNPAYGNVNVPTNNSTQVYRGSIGDLHVSELIEQAKQQGTAYNSCIELMNALNTLSINHISLGGKVYYCKTDAINNKLIINNNLIFANTPDKLGSGTVVVEGDLEIAANSFYYDTSISNIYNIASVAWIATGKITIKPAVTKLAGAYIALDNPTDDSIATFITDPSTLQLEIKGLVLARKFNFGRKNIGTESGNKASERIIYDTRLITNPPPGLEDLSKSLPTIK
ncbi:MAG: LamG domain-containing protein [Patescibacteria group bacterium]|jgi:hypothetical protein